MLIKFFVRDIVNIFNFKYSQWYLKWKPHKALMRSWSIIHERMEYWDAQTIIKSLCQSQTNEVSTVGGMSDNGCILWNKILLKYHCSSMTFVKWNKVKFLLAAIKQELWILELCAAYGF